VWLRLNSKIELIMDTKKMTSYYFFNEFLKKIPSLEVLNNNLPDIEISLQNVDFINSETLPYLLSLGDLIKRTTGKPAELYIPWKPELLFYLDNINFLDVVRKNNIFCLFEETLGGYSFGKISQKSKIYYFKFQETKYNISNEIRNSFEIFENIFEEDLRFGKENASRFYNLITELCLNGCTHSESSCSLLLEYNKARRSIQIGISDSGIGYLNSFVKKGHVFDESKTLNNNTKAIINAAYHRADEKVFGIYSAFKHIINKKIVVLDEWLNENKEIHGQVKVHTGNTQIIFNSLGFGKYINDKNEFMKFLENDAKNNDEKYRKIKLYENEFPGVHIEIMFPI